MPEIGELRKILLKSLEGSRYDLEDLKKDLRDDSEFEDLGLDSLDMTEFFLRIEERFEVEIRQEDHVELISLAAIQRYLDRSAG